MAKHILLLAIALVCSGNLFAQSDPNFDSEAITKLLYEHTNDDSPGLAVGIVSDGKIVYEHYAGYSNLEHQIKVDKDTRFNIASNAKQYTALCILRLSEQGKLNLEDDFRKYLPDFYKNVPDKITISNLLTHTSGIRDYCDLCALTGRIWWQLFLDNDDVIDGLKAQKDLNFKPGTDYVYSNSNYILLAALITKVSGKDFSEVAKEMFEELKMPSTSFVTNYTAIIPNKSRPYGNWNGWREEPTITEVHGDGALYTTLQDQLKWEQIIQANDGKYLSQELIKDSQSPLASSIANAYGYGVEFRTMNGIDYSFHNGVTGAYRATFLRFPSKNVSIVVMSNNRNVPAEYLAWQIVSLTLGIENGPYPANPEKIEKLKDISAVVGNYRSDDGTVISITEKDGYLYREMFERKPVKLIHEKGALFEYETIEGLKMHFTNIGAAEQCFTLYLSTQTPSTFHKMPNASLTDTDRSELNGSFYNDETDTEIVLKHIEGNTYALTKNGRERKAELLLEDYMKMNSYEILFMRDDKNNVIGLRVNMKRIRNVIFLKS